MLICAVPESRPPLIESTLAWAEPDADHRFRRALEPVTNARKDPDDLTDRDRLVRQGARGCVHAVVDIVCGRRPASQLSRWATQEVVVSLAQIARAAHRHRPRPGRAHVQVTAGAAEIMLPWRYAPLAPGILSPLSPNLVAGTDGADTAASHTPVVVGDPGAPLRLAALTARVEAWGSRWQCTHLGWLTAYDR